MKVRNWKERICALLLAVTMVVTWMLPDMSLTVQAAPGDEVDVIFIVKDKINKMPLNKDITISVYDERQALVETVTEPESDGNYRVPNLRENEEYTYKIVKPGYNEFSSRVTPIRDDNHEYYENVEIEMADISITSMSDLKEKIEIGATVQMRVDNPISGVAYTWTSSNDQVATVSDEGLVTAVGSGEAEIIASYNGKYSNSIEISVKKTDVVISLTANVPEGSNNENVESILCEVTGIPSDAKGSISFSATNEKNGKETEAVVDLPETTWVYAAQDGEKLTGKISFAATYEGDYKYNKSDPAKASVEGLKSNNALKFEDKENTESNPRILTYSGDSDEVTFEIKLDVDSRKDRDTDFISSDEKILEVEEKADDNNTAIVTVKGTGAAFITVKAKETEEYLEDEKNYYVFVQKPIDISQVNDRYNLVSDPVSRDYNGEKDIDATVLLNESILSELGIYTDDLNIAEGLIVYLSGRIIGDADVGNYNKIEILSINDVKGKTPDGDTISVKDRLEIKNYKNVEIDAKVTIQKRKVFLTTKDFNIDYAVNINCELKKTDMMVFAEAKDDDTGIIESDKESIDLSGVKAKVNKSIYDVGCYKNEIHPDLSTISNEGKYNNYIFEESDTLGTLVVNAPTISLDTILKESNVNLVVEGGNLYKNDEEIWISGGTLKAFFSEDSELREYFDQIIFCPEKDGNLRVDLVRNGYGRDWKETTKVTGKLWLQDSKNEKNASTPVEFSFIVDNSAPKFEFGEWKKQTQVLNTWIGAITFDNFQNLKEKNSYSLENVSCWDGEKEENSESDLETKIKESGVKEWKYHCYKVTDDKELTKESLQDYVKSDSLTWTEGSGNSIPVIKEFTDQDLDEIKGNYIVLVNVTDNVGNSAIYSTNGLVVDIDNPSIQILRADGTTINPNTYYNKSVDYKVVFTDGSLSSGLKNAEIKILDGDQTKEIKKIDFRTEKGFTSDDIKDGFSIKQINELSQYTVTEVDGQALTVNENYDSNNLKIKVTVWDQAENIYTATQDLMIDSTNPEIKVSYDNNNSKNGKYFKDDRIMTIEYKERNLDTDPTKNGISFDVIKDGVEYEDCTLSDLRSIKALNIIWVDEKIDDKIGDKPTTDFKVQDYTNDRVCTLQLKFYKDGEYTIIPKCRDMAGRTTELKTEQNFVIDKTPPKINVTYSSNGAVINPLTYEPDEGEGVYSKEAVKATVTVNETNFWSEENGSREFNNQWDFSGTKGINSNGENIELADYLATANVAKNWNSNTTIRTNSEFAFNVDANYTFTFSYTDLAGNKTVYNPDYFTVDQTDPTGEISLDREGSIWSTIWRALTFDIFRDSAYDVRFNAKDGTSGVKSIEYYKTRLPLGSEEEVEAIKSWKVLGTEGNLAERNGSFGISPDEQFVVYEKITDYAGRVTYIYPTNGAVADNTQPEISITEVNRNASSNGIYNEDIVLHVDVQDPTNGDTYSGLERVWYDVSASGNVSASETITLMDNSDNRVQSHQNWSGNITIPASRYNSNDIRVQVHALDFSGNQYDSEVVPLSIDITEPTIQVTYDLNSPLNDRYYNATRTATVVVTERNFDESAVRFDITNTDGTQPSISGWSHSSDSGVSDSATHTCRVTFSADGDYTFTLNTTDLAGNDSNYTRVDEFTIDQTDPTIQVSYDNNNDAVAGYYNAERTATITINEHNFNASEVNAQITARLQNRGVSAPGIGGWSTRGDVHTASVTFSADADYTFDVDYTDLAGNAAADYDQDSFTIDQTDPEIEFFDIEDKSANKDTVAPGVSYSDINYDENGVKITIEGAEPDHSEEAVDGRHTDIPNGESIKMADFEHTEDNDDVYTMTAEITDRAGNTTEESIVFSVNRFGSTYVFSDETREYLAPEEGDEYIYTNEPQDIEVTERNVDTLVNNGIFYGRDGELVNLEEGTDYTVRESGSDVSWKEYRYDISKDNFEQEGHYTVTIDSEDRAENLMNNQTKGLDIEFVVDKTAPSVVITGIEEDAYTADTRDMVINVTDNTAAKQVEVLIGGQVVETFDQEMIQESGGKLTYTINSSSSPQLVEAVAVDKAGNEAVSEAHTVLVSANLFVQYINNTPLLIGSIILLLVIAGAVCYIVIIRKRREQQK